MQYKQALIVKLVFFGLLTLILTTCASNQPSPTTSSQPEIVDIQVTSKPAAIPSLEPYVFATSEPGSATLHGVLIVLDPRSILPASDDAIYLVSLDKDAPISTIPQFAEGDDVPQAEVDERTGEFVFTNIQSGRYAVVALTMGGTQFPTRKMDSGDYAIFDVTEEFLDQTMELGDLTLP